MRFDENSDVSTTHLGRSDKTRNDKLKAEESFPISEYGYTSGKLLDGTECQLLLDTIIHVQIQNGQCISVLFIISVIVDVHGHRFEIYTLVSEIHENVDLVLGIKNVFELEGVINSRDCCFKFLNRSLPIFPENCVILKPKEQKLIKVKAQFIDEISGLAIVQILDGGTHST